MAYLAQGMVDRAQAVIGFEEQKQLAWYSPQQAADFACRLLRLVPQHLLLPLRACPPQMIRLPLGDLHQFNPLSERLDAFT